MGQDWSQLSLGQAQVLASLNHPNIGAIHGLEEEDGVRALVLELIEGEDLSERIAKGPIPLRESLQIAIQIAEALRSANCEVECDVIGRSVAHYEITALIGEGGMGQVFRARRAAE